MQKIENSGNSYDKKIFIFFNIAMIMLLFTRLRAYFDSDLFHYLLNGREIVNNGIPYTNFHFVEPGYGLVLQEWLYDAFLYKVFDVIGPIGITLWEFVLIVGLSLLVICTLRQKYKNYNYLIIILSSAFYFLFFLCSISFRAYYISLSLMFIEYIFIKSDKFKYIFPLLLLISINCHASFWPFFYLLNLPFLVEWFFKDRDRFKKRLLLLVCSLGVLFANPYGLENILYIFKSFGSNSLLLDLGIKELTKIPLLSANALILLVCLAVSIVFFKKLDISTRVGSLIYIALSSTCFRNSIFIVFVLVFLFTDSYISEKLKELYDNDKLGLKQFNKKVAFRCIIAFSLLLILPLISHAYTQSTRVDYKHPKNIVNYLKKKNVKKVFTTFNVGSYMEWYGFKTYMDANPELYLKSVNHKKNTLKEYNKLREGSFKDIDKIDYGFKYYVSDNFDFDAVLSNNPKYKKIMKDGDCNLYEKRK